MVCTTRKSDRWKMTGYVKMQCVIAYLDYFVFVKNGYSVWAHLIPFAIASLLLLTLSVTKENLLLNLAEVLRQPSWIWLPAALLTAVATVVYIIAIKAQIRQAYLWSDGNLRRTLFTSLVYIILCTLMAYMVLMSAPSYEITLGGIWACLLVAVLSLTGVGWSVPSSWVESINVKCPNYTDSHLSIKKLADALKDVRSKSTSDKRDVEDFLEAVENLSSDIKKNLQIEPKWAEDNLQKNRSASEKLYDLGEQIRAQFLTNNESAVMDFAPACRYKAKHYLEFIRTIKALNDYWPEWQYKESK
jgi:hypothetical protein